MDLNSDVDITNSITKQFNHVSPLFCDYNATTPIALDLIESASEAYKSHWFNPSASYHLSATAGKAIDKLRARFSRFLSGRTTVVLCSSATEAINQAVYSLSQNFPGINFVITDSEHSAVSKAAAKYYKDSFEVIPASKLLDFPKKANYSIYFVQTANNETGIINPIKEFRAKVGPNAIIVLDASQSFGKQDDLIEVLETADCVIFSPHKFYGPKGVGVLVWSDRMKELHPLISGGGQQSGLRSGTENTPLLFMLNKWLESLHLLVENYSAVESFRNQFEEQLLAEIPEAFSINSGNSRLKNTATICIPGILSDELVAALDVFGIMASSGSACNSGTTEPSKSYLATGLDWDSARCVIRFSFGYGNLAIDPIKLAKQVSTIIQGQR